MPPSFSDETLASMEYELTLEEMKAAARTDLRAYAMYVHREAFLATQNGKFTFPRHLEKPAHRLMAAFARQQQWTDHPDYKANAPMRLAFVMPPDSMKSFFIVRSFLEWAIGNDPETWAMLIMAETQGQAWPAGRAIRNLIDPRAQNDEGRRYREIFPEVLPDDDTQAWRDGQFFVKRSNAAPEPTLTSVGLDGPVQGRRVRIMVFDDPVKQQEASSQIIMRKKAELVSGTILSRMVEDAILVTVQTRWGPLDFWSLWKRIRAKTLVMPAIGYWDRTGTDADGRPIWGGEALWPEYRSIERLEEIKSDSTSRMFDLTYQGDERAVAGLGMFSRDWFVSDPHPKTDLPHLTIPPSEVERLVFRRIVRAWDLAATPEGGSNDDPDWLVGLKMGLTTDERLVVLHVARMRVGPDGVRAAIVDRAVSDGRAVHIIAEQEGGASGKMTISDLSSRLLGYTFYGKTTGSINKAQRAEPLAAAAENGKVWLMEGDWNDAYLDEMETVFIGSHDDQADASAMAFSYLANQVPSPVEIGGGPWSGHRKTIPLRLRTR